MGSCPCDRRSEEETLESAEIFLSSILISVTMRLSHSVGAFILPLLQHVCKKKTDRIWVFEKNQQLGLLGSKWFNRIYYLHVLHSAHKQEAVAATFSTENLFLKKFTHDSAA